MRLLRLIILQLFIVCVLSKDKLFALNRDKLLSSTTDAWFESLSEHELREHWSTDDGGTIAEKAEMLQNFIYTVTIDVKLVGFNDQDSKIFLSRNDFNKYLQVLNDIKPSYIIDTKKQQSHELPYHTKYLYRVTHAPSTLVDELTHAIQNHVSQVSKNTKAGTLFVPIRVVNDIIEKFNEQTPLSYSIYILHLPTPMIAASDGTMTQKLPSYAYVAPTDTQAHPVANNNENAPPPVCTTQVWPGRKGRYVWMDLVSGPVSYGPQTSGDGIFTEFSLPRFPDNIQKRDELLTMKPKFLTEITNSIHKVVKHLVTPSIHKFPLPYMKYIVINVILIHDGAVSGNADPDGYFPGWSKVANELKSLAMVGQKIDFITHAVSFHDCELCVAAYTHSLKSHTSNVLTDGLRTQVHQYLDSKEMHDWLEHFESNFWGLKRSTKISQEYDPSEIKVTNVFVYNLRTVDIVLLDRFYQAVPYDDMIIAVQTEAPAAVVDYSCNGHSLQFDPRDSVRAVMGALLQSIWGVSVTSQHWNPFTNETETDFMWSIGDTPFDYFSTSKYLSFSQRDAAARNTLISDVYETMKELKIVFEHFSSYEKDIDEVLSQKEHLLFVRRWNVFSFKLTKTQHFLSLNNFNQCLYYLRSARHDLRVLHQLVHKAISALHPVMQCTQDVSPHASMNKSTRLVILIMFVSIFAFIISQSYSDSTLMRWYSKKFEGKPKRAHF